MRPHCFQDQGFQHVEGRCMMQILNKLLSQSYKTYCWKGFSTETAEQFTGLSNLHYSRSQNECEDWSRLFILLPQVVAQWFMTTHGLYFWSVLWHSLWNGCKSNGKIMTVCQTLIFLSLKSNTKCKGNFILAHDEKNILLSSVHYMNTCYEIFLTAICLYSSYRHNICVTEMYLL